MADNKETKEKNLQEQIDQLGHQVAKQRKILASTAQQLLSLQLKQNREKLASIPNPDPASMLASASGKIPSSSDSIDTSEFATNQDLVQLVGELQGQLTLLDERSKNRVANSLLTEDDETILPIPNVDGKNAPASIYPATIGDYKKLTPDQLIENCSFYELLPETAEEEARMKAFMAGKIKSPNVPPEEFKLKASDYPKKVIDELYVSFRTFIGLRKFKN